MNNNTLPLVTPAQFVEQWLPDYEQKRRELNVLKSKANTPKYCVERGQLCEKAHRLKAAMFTQALAAFEAHVRAETWREACEAMRERCAVECQVEADRVEIGETPRTVFTVINNAPIPEIPKNEKM